MAAPVNAARVGELWPDSDFLTPDADVGERVRPTVVVIPAILVLHSAAQRPD
jgi:hypothetical protein